MSAPYQPKQDFGELSPRGFNGEFTFYPSGPGDGFGINHGYLWPWTRVATEEEAIRICRFMNAAFKQGYEAARAEMRKALGL